MAKQAFAVSQVLTAAQMAALQANDYNITVSPKTGTYVLVADDVGTRITMNAAGATAITVNTSLFGAGDTLAILNIGAGVSTITAGTATVTTSGTLALAQWAGGILYFTSASAAVFIPGGVSAASTAFVGCSLTKSALQTISAATYTAVTWNTETFDTNAMHDNVTSNSRITIPTGKAGYYSFDAYITSNTSAELSSIQFYVNGVGVQINTRVAAVGNSGIGANYKANLTVGDYVEVFVYSAGGFDVGSNAQNTRITSLSCAYLGA